MPHNSNRIALFPGTFDPITNGHMDVICRAAPLFDKFIVAVGTNPAKGDLFSLEEREAMIRDIVLEQKLDVTVETYRGLTVDFARTRGVTVMVRGLRNATDLAFEFQLAIANRAVADLETVFIMSGEPYGFTSSSLIKQIASGGNIDRLDKLLPHQVIEAMKTKIVRIKELARQSDGLKQ